MQFNDSEATADAVLLPKIGIKYSWIFDARHDLLFFYAPIVVAVSIYCMVHMSAVIKAPILLFAALQGFGLGPFHAGATWFHYLDKTNRDHYWGTKENRRDFFYLPLLIFASTVGCTMLSPQLSTIIYMGWTVQHLVKQNVGIGLLYHNQKAGEAIVNRNIEVRSQYAAGVMFTCIFIQSLLPGVAFFTPITVLAAVATVVLSILYMRDLMLQMRQGLQLNLPSFSFWLFSMVCLCPFAFGDKYYAEAILIPIIMHWFQYIGLNYLLVKRKYADPANDGKLPAARPLMLLTAIGFLFVGIIASIGVTGISTNVINDLNSMPGRVLLGIMMGIGNTHYFQDAYIWRFREPFNRKAILTYLKPAR